METGLFFGVSPGTVWYIASSVVIILLTQAGNVLGRMQMNFAVYVYFNLGFRSFLRAFIQGSKT